MGVAGALALTRSGFAAQLTDHLSLRVPSVHVGLGKHPARGIDREFAAGSDAFGADEFGGAALFAIAAVFQHVKEFAAEVVVIVKRADFLRAHTRHLVSFLRGAAHLLAAEVE